MGMFRNLLMQQTLAANDLTEVYAYAAQYNVTAAQVDDIIAEQPAMRDRLIAWKYLIHSLANTGCTPYLVGNGVSYINTEIKAEEGSDVETVCISTEENKAILGGRKSYGAQGVSLGFFGEDYLYAAYRSGGARYIVGIPMVGDIRHIISINGTKTSNINPTLTVDNVSLEVSSSYAHTFHYIYIFAVNNNSDGNNLPDSRIATSATKISYVKITTGTPDANTGIKPNKYYGVPYSLNGIYGMLDLTSDTFKASAVQNGLFDYELRDSNNNVVVI